MDGHVNGAEYNDIFNGFRPIVCLKSDVQLRKNDDGSYTII